MSFLTTPSSALFAHQGLLSCDELKSIPFLVLGNKVDIPQAVSEAELRQALGLHQTTGKVRARYALFNGSGVHLMLRLALTE